MKFTKYLSFLIVGILFGIVMIKAEIVSWYRIFEMFHFHSFHMYGVIGSAIFVGILIIQLIKRKGLNSFNGKEILLKDKDSGITRYLVGGTIFGLGWALVGACPGPMFVLLGAGYFPILVVIAGAMLGTLVYGLVRAKLPH